MTLKRTGLSLQRNGTDPADLHLDDQGNLATVTDAEAIGQHVRQRLMTHEGEWFLDAEAGVTWLQDVLGQGYDPTLAEAVTKAEILETDGVTGVDSFSVRFDQSLRQVQSYNITVTTVYDQGVQI